MPAHTFARPAGRVVEIIVESPALRDNWIGDPSSRAVAVYLPPGYDDDASPLPLFVDLASFTSSGLKRLAWTSFGESVPQRVDRLMAAGTLGPAVFAFPDAFTSLGGNQYIDTPVLGNWETFLCEDMLGALESQFNIRRERDGRAIYGKSSGGYGALIHGMRHADTWGAVACHSGDMAFDLLYRREFPNTLDALGRYESKQAFLEKLRSDVKISGGDFHALMGLAMAATYDPGPKDGDWFRLPVDEHTCALDEDAWARWLAHDPVQLAARPEIQAALSSLRGLFVDCGSRDQYLLHYGARQLHGILEGAGVAHRYEEFPDTHSGIDYRLDESLPFLYRALAG